MKQTRRSMLCCYHMLAILLVGLIFAPTPSLAQGSGAFKEFTTLSDVDFGVWSGADVIAATTATEQDEFCIIYRLQTIASRAAMRVNYEFELTGPTQGNDYVLQSSGGNLPVSIRMSRAAGSTININPNSGNGLTPAASYAVTFPTPVPDFNTLADPTYEAPGGCNDALFDFEASIAFADIIALADPTGTFASNFTIRVDPPTYLESFLNDRGGATDFIDFTVSITIESGVYIDQLSNAIELNVGTTRAEFCIWSLDGADVNVTATSDNPGSFTLINEDSSGALVDSIPYVLRLRDLRARTGSRLRNGVTKVGLPSESNASCSGPQGLNYRLNFRVRNISDKRAGDYTDRITLTVAPN